MARIPEWVHSVGSRTALNSFSWRVALKLPQVEAGLSQVIFCLRVEFIGSINVGRTSCNVIHIDRATEFLNKMSVSQLELTHVVVDGGVQ